MLKLFERSQAKEAIEEIDTRVKPHIRIINGALDEDANSPQSIILQGRIDPSTLRFLKVDNEYQRPLGDRADIFTALKEQKIVPNIEIGVRGQDYSIDGDDYLIYLPAYIIDGWQRIGTALRLLELIPNHPIRIFASVHFGTDQLWERHRFTELNKNVSKVSPNLHLRNMRDTNEAVLTLFGLSHNSRDFALFKKVCWSQSMQRGHMISSVVLAKSAVHLHRHQTAMRTGRVEDISEALRKAAASIGLQNFRTNISTFYELLNECWPFHVIEFRRSAPQIKATFIYQVARVLSSHPVFWDQSDRVLTIGADDRRKLAKFPINDPQVSALAGTGGQAANILYQLIVDHMNSGRRTQRLHSRFEASNVVSGAAS